MSWHFRTKIRTSQVRKYRGWRRVGSFSQQASTVSPMASAASASLCRQLRATLYRVCFWPSISSAKAPPSPAMARASKSSNVIPSFC